MEFPVTVSTIKPVDIRIIDPASMRSLRELLAEPRGWTGQGADFAIARALFDAENYSHHIQTRRWFSSTDRPDRYPDGWQPPDPAEVPVWFAETISRDAVPSYSSYFDPAVDLLGKVLPGVGFTLDVEASGKTAASLDIGGIAGPVQLSKSPQLAIIAAILDHLEREPGAAAAYREP